MKILLAPDSFKGSLSSEKIVSIMEKKVLEVFPKCEVIKVPIADGGEGTVEKLVKITSGSIHTIEVLNPLFQPINAAYGILNKDTAIIEMAAASGLTRIDAAEGNACITTTFGTGQLIKDALDKGYKNIVVAIGGSATNDGGIGALCALGVKFLDGNKKELKPIGKNLIKIEEIDLSGMHQGIKDTAFTVMCDVNNPFIGARGATYMYGPQKGANDSQLVELEAGMNHLASLILKNVGKDIRYVKGAGAAGGLGGALYAFLEANLKSGIDTILDTIGFDKLIEDVDVIITGEGRIDEQSACGKVLTGIGNRAKTHEIPVIAIAGSIGYGAEQVYEQGISAIVPTVNHPMSLDEALIHAEDLLNNAVELVCRVLKIGFGIK